ncbi:hypothetical protein JCM15548_11306 [Geofilum rubicundum JCM 15548]|uniref:Surface glycan-binding protein B xyloglucan binding domain-containing protein n=2 Tax=Geofilum TaxID=1236988 RepID=A0A0E9LV66_9BACT|nr:hypothetical protein JCM15548_11306 [Geofilum rubicundum JCM 15548]
MCLLVVGVAFTGCDEEDKADTNQMNTGAIALNAFGPSPAIRGGELRFIGTNLDKVTSIDLPGAEGITDITVVGNYEIRITIPQTAQPGLVVLNTPDGKITSKTPIGYSEPISISGIAPLALKAGEVLTIEGDYLNIVEEIIFADGIHVLKADFESQARAKIEVKVPMEAQSGKVIVSDGADLLSDGEEIPAWVYSEEELDVTLPEITAVTPNPLKAGGVLTITGVDFDLVHKVILPGGAEIVVEDATTSIVVEDTPADIKEGIITLVAFSGVEVESEALELVKPAIASLSATTVKNGAAFTISGTHLDLVTRAEFQNGSVDAADFVAHSAEAIELTLPLTSTDGAFVLHTASETSTSGEALTFVVPTLASFAPVEAKPNQSVVLTGTHLDLVSSVWLGDTEADISGQTETELTVTINVGSESGPITVLTVNGTEVNSSTDFTVLTNLPDISGYLQSKGVPGEILTIQGTDLLLIKELIFPDDIYATAYGSKSDTEIEVYVPEEVVTGMGTIRMITYEGEEGSLPEVFLGGTDPVQDASYVFFDFDTKGSWWGSYGAVESDPALMLSGNYFRINADLPGGWNDFFWRNGRNDFKTEDVTVADWVIKMDVNVLGDKSQDFKFRLNGSDGDFWAIIPGFENKGGWYTVTIPLTDFYDQDGTGTNQLPNVQNIDADFGLATQVPLEQSICASTIYALKENRSTLL